MKYIFCIPIALLAGLYISVTINDIQDERRYQEYIDSIKVGDIFEPNFVKVLDDDPFMEEIDYSEHSKIIIDIKENHKGETWVKYKYLKDGDVEFTEEIHSFVMCKRRVKQSEI